MEFGFDFFDERLGDPQNDQPERLSGLLTLEQVEQLVRAGLPVLVHEDATAQLAQPVPTAEFEAWITDFQQSFPAPKAAQSLGGLTLPTPRASKPKKR